MKYAQTGSAPYVVASLFTSDDHATYSVPSGAMSAAGKLLTRNTVLNGGMISTAGATATRLLQETPPSEEATIQMPLNDANREDPSQKTSTAPSGPRTTRAPWSYISCPPISWGSLRQEPPSEETTDAR